MTKSLLKLFGVFIYFIDCGFTRLLDNIHRIRVIIRGATSSTPGDVLGYISDVYAKIWDEMIAAGKPFIQCTVAAETSNTSLIQDIDFTTLQDIDILYTTCSTQLDLDRIISSRATARLPPLKVNVLPKSSLSHVINLDTTCQISIYEKIAMGGTFDHIHNGHFKLLTLAAHLTRSTLIVGLVPDSMLTKKAHASRLQPYHTRRQNIYAFLMQLRTSLQVDVVQLEDAYGPTITDPDIQAIVVSSETIANAVKINQIRQSKNFKLLDILVTRRSNVATLSSTFVRQLQNN